MLLAKKMIVLSVLFVWTASFGFCACGDSEAVLQEEAVGDQSVMINAYVVQVAAEVVDSTNLDPEKSMSQQITQIIEYLADPQKAQMLAGVKVLMNNSGRESSVQETHRKYLRLETSDYSWFECGHHLDIRSRTGQDQTINLEYEFRLTFTPILEGKNGFPQPQENDFSWESGLLLQSGELVIAGATFNGQTATFLILSATIQESAD